MPHLNPADHTAHHARKANEWIHRATQDPTKNAYEQQVAATLAVAQAILAVAAAIPPATPPKDTP